MTRQVLMPLRKAAICRCENALRLYLPTGRRRSFARIMQMASICIATLGTISPAYAYTTAFASTAYAHNLPIGSPVGDVQVHNDVQTAWTSTHSQATARLDTTGISGSTSGQASAFSSVGRLSVSAVSGATMKTGFLGSNGDLYGRDAGWNRSDATASWSDKVTIDAQGLAGQPGTLNALLRLSGAASADASPYVRLHSPDGGFLIGTYISSAMLTVSGNGLDGTDPNQHWDDGCAALGLDSRVACALNDNSSPNSWLRNYSVNQVRDIPIELSFVYGRPLDLTYSIIADSRADAALDYYKFSSQGGAEGIADMSHTLLWGGINGVFDTNRSPIANYTISSLSGFDYRFVSAVPELDTWLMLLAGLGLIGLRKRYALTLQSEANFGLPGNSKSPEHLWS